MIAQGTRTSAPFTSSDDRAMELRVGRLKGLEVAHKIEVIVIQSLMKLAFF
jgi:hypothetical protein